MSDNLWFFTTVVKVTVAVSIACCVLVLGSVLVGIPTTRTTEGFAAAASLVPFPLGAWWLFRRLQVRYSRRLARSLTASFAVCTPIFLCLSMPFGVITGGYAEAVVGSKLAILVGAFVGPILLTAGLSLAACVFVRSTTRRIAQHEGTEV